MKKEFGNLCVTLRLGDSVVVGDDLLVTVVELKNKQLRIVFRAPKNVNIKRLPQQQTQIKGDRNGNR